MLKKMALNIGGVSFVLAAIQLFAAISNIILGNVLSKNDFGEFVLMRTLILFIPPLAIWGQDLGTARFFSRNNATQYKWHIAFAKVLGVSTLLVLVGIAAANFVYHLSAYKLVVLFIGSVSLCTIILFANLLRSQRKYVPAIVMQNGYRGLFFLVLLAVYFIGNITKVHAIVGYVFIIVVVAMVDTWIAFKFVEKGDKPVTGEFFKTGTVLLASQLSVTVMTSLDSLFVQPMLGNEALALYAAVLVPIQAFNIIGRAGKYVWVPEFGKQRSSKLKVIGLLLSGVVLLILVILFFGAEPLLHFLYRGKYDHGVTLLRILAFAGAGRLLYSLSSSVIVGGLPKQALNYYLSMNVTAVFVYGILLSFMITRIGVIGAALALLIVTVFRLLISYGIVFKFRNVDN